VYSVSDNFYMFISTAVNFFIIHYQFIKMLIVTEFLRGLNALEMFMK